MYLFEFLILVFIALPVGLGLLFYFCFKKLGYPKTAKYFTIIYGLIILAIGFLIAFEDRFFTKNDAKVLIEAQGIKLTDEFELLKNESVSAISDYYHTFTLKVSQRDKQEIILKIKSADNFKMDTTSIDSLQYQQRLSRYFGKKVIQNYETETSYVREYFEPSGREGYSPTFIRISISKDDNELIFEDIVE